MNILKIAGILTGLLLVSTAQADWDEHYGHGFRGGGYDDYVRLEKRQNRQHRRIEKGIHRGQLTRREAKKLWREHRKTERLTQRFTRDGWLSRKERHILKARLENANKRIYELKHNYHERGHHHDKRYVDSSYYPRRKCQNLSRYYSRDYRTGYNGGIFINW